MGCQLGRLCHLRVVQISTTSNHLASKTEVKLQIKLIILWGTTNQHEYSGNLKRFKSRIYRWGWAVLRDEYRPIRYFSFRCYLCGAQSFDLCINIICIFFVNYTQVCRRLECSFPTYCSSKRRTLFTATVTQIIYICYVRYTLAHIRLYQGHWALKRSTSFKSFSISSRSLSRIFASNAAIC